MKRIKLFSTLSILLFLVACTHAQRPNTPQDDNQFVGPREERKVQVALLLDTSNSMDGLIEQAKSRLWNIVNTLSTLKYNGADVSMEIALYEYGNSGLDANNDWIRMVTPLTTDLDLISEQLYGLRTNGGLEYCGSVIKSSLSNLKWSDDRRDLKMIFIAGNERYDQGKISYKEVSLDAVGREIFINTIYCGNYQTGVNELWQNGAVQGKGKYFNIDSDKKVRFIATPYDDLIQIENTKLNDTYMGYGSLGMEKKRAQSVQDANAANMSKENMTERVISKGSKSYKNESWDIVDANKSKAVRVETLSESELPDELKGKSLEEKNAIIAQKSKDREDIQKNLGELAKKREEYINAELKKLGSSDDLGSAIANSILELSQKKGYK